MQDNIDPPTPHDAQTGEASHRRTGAACVSRSRWAAHRPILTLAGLTIREAARARLLPCFAGTLLALVLTIPLAVKGDGTAAGQLRVAVSYTLGALSILMGIVTLWMSCGAISRDIEHGHLRLTVVKPVRRRDVWLGRWIGMLAIDAALLALCGIALYAVLQWKTGRPALNEEGRRVVRESILTARRRIAPDLPTVEQEAARRLNRLRADRGIPETLADGALETIRRQVAAERSVLAPGRTAQWTFNVAASVPAGAAVSLRFRLTSPLRTTRAARGAWTIGPAERPDAVVLPAQDYPDGIHVITLPDDLTHKGMRIRARFRNGDAEVSHTVLFPATEAPELLIRESGFAGNLARALMVVLFRLALLSALGLSAGALFSFPVATFAAASIVLGIFVSHFFAFASAPERADQHHRHHDEPPRVESPVERAGSFLVGQVSRIAEPAFRARIARSVSDGILISWQTVGKTLLVIVVHAAILGGLGSAALAKREIALPP